MNCCPKFEFPGSVVDAVEAVCVSDLVSVYDMRLRRLIFVVGGRWAMGGERRAATT